MGSRAAAVTGTAASRPPSGATPWLTEAAFWGIAAFLLLHRLGGFPLKDWDEAIYAEVIRELLRTGDWLTMHYNNAPYFNKPPLYFWLGQVPMRFFGFSEWSSRLPGVVFGAATLWQTRRWGEELAGRLAGIAAALLLSTSAAFLENGSRHATPDALLLLLSVAALRSQWLARDGRHPRWAAPALLGLAFLTKGAAAFSLLACLATIHLLAADHRRWLRRDYLAGGAVLALCILPWYVAQTIVNGTAFWLKHGYWSVWQRLTVAGAPAATHAQGPAYYLVFLAGQARGLWPLGLLAALLLMRPHGRGSLGSRARAAAPGHGALTLAVAAAVPVLLFSLSRNKVWWYVLPSLPPLALLCGLLVQAGWARLWPARGWRGVFVALLALQALLLATDAHRTLAAQVANGRRHFGTLASLARTADRAARERGLRRPILVYPRESPTAAVYVTFPVVVDPELEDRLRSGSAARWPAHDGVFLILRNDEAAALQRSPGVQAVAEKSGRTLLLIEGAASALADRHHGDAGRHPA